jgi:hypothetical protein
LIGPAAVVNSVQNTQSPDNAATIAGQAEQGRLNRGVQVRGQDLTDSRARELRADATANGGKPPPGYRWKPDGSMEAIPGGPADVKASAAPAAKVADAMDVLALLDQAGPLIDKSTNSYAGKMYDEGKRVFGGSTGGAEAAAQLRALEGALIAKMPKMSGPQSDKDVLLYKQMAGQIGDDTIPAPRKKAAMQTIREINNRHAGVTENTAPSARKVVRTGTMNGRKVVQYSDGTTDYAD